VTGTLGRRVEPAVPIVLPFRWSLSGALPDLSRVTPVPDPYPGYRDDLLTLAAQVVKTAGRADLAFVGRSCESIFDLLAALVVEPSTCLLNISLGGPLGSDGLCSAALRASLAAARLDGPGLTARPRPVALVDVVASGGTMGRVMRAMALTCEDRGLMRRVRVIALRRWGFDAWRDSLARGVSGRALIIPEALWEWLADLQPKLTPSFTPSRWTDPRAGRADRAPRHLEALRAAVALRAWARERATRAAFVRRLKAPPRWSAIEPREGFGWGRHARPPARGARERAALDDWRY
jgi:hypothetical protein